VTVLLACLLGVVTISLGALVLMLREQRARLVESERRSRLGAEHARLHLSVLARTGDQLSVALESYDEALRELVDVIVPWFADWFSLDLVNDVGQVHRVAAGRAGMHAVKLPVDVAHIHPDGNRLVRQVIETGRDEVFSEVAPEAHPGSLAAPGVGVAAGPASGVESMMVVPVHVRGLAFGALSFVTTPGRRGYRKSDLETAHGVANRVAVAVERVLLWRDSRLAEQTAVKRAEQLRRLMGAALSVNTALAESEILAVVAAQARKVLSADRASVCTTAGEVIAVSSTPESRSLGPSALVAASCRLVRQFNRPLRSSSKHVEGVPAWAEPVPPLLSDFDAPAWIAVPVPSPAEETRRVVFAEGAQDGGFGPEDESVLVLLAQMASVALVNARLYQEVRGSERRLRTVVESSPLAIAELAPDGQVRWWNSAAEHLFTRFAPGDGEAEVPLDAESEKEWQETLDRARRALASVGTDIRVRGSDGTGLELSVSTAPVLDGSGEVAGIVVVTDDVTERRRVLAQVHNSERLAAMARLAGGLAHDFNNLLTVIMGSSQLLARHEKLDPTLTEEVSSIQRAGLRAAGLTAQLLAIGRDRPREPAALDPDAALSSIRPLLTSVLGDDIELEIECAAGPVRILTDRADLERAVLNLAINARDAMPEGGRFVLTTSVVPTRAAASFRNSQGSRKEMSSAARDRVAICATDTGHGMDEATAKHCFDPFFSTKEVGRGTGLGLFAVQALVSQAGGEVTLETSPGRGTTFTLWFPKVDDSLDQHDGHRQPADEQGVDRVRRG
jgi:PAS domain S-box-containing protein